MDTIVELKRLHKRVTYFYIRPLYIQHKKAQSLDLARYLPNTSILAYYDFLGQIINLNSFDLARFKQSKFQNNYTKMSSLLPLCQHEYTHWLDNTSTLWGINFLNTLYKTYDIEDFREFLNGNQDFINLNNTILNMRDHHYNIKKFDITDNPIPWKYQYIVQVVEDDYIKIIVNFLNKNTHEIICSVPMSVLSILETSAIAQELGMRITLIMTMLKDGEEIVESKLFEKEIIKQIYNPSLTEYSVAVHIVANAIQVEDIMVAYTISSILSRFVLNFPAKYFNEISLSNSIEELNFLSLQNIQLFENTLKKKDISLLFFLIANKLKFNKNYDEKSIQQSIINVLDSFGIQIDEIFIKTVEQDYQNKYEYFTTYNYQPIEDIMEAGYENFKKIGIFGQRFYNFQELKTPKALLGDDSEFPCFTNFIKTFSPKQHKSHLLDVTHAVETTFEIMHGKENV